MNHPVQQLLAGAGRPALLLHDPDSADLARALASGLDGDVRRHEVGQPVPEAPRRWPVAVLVVADGASLRRSVSVLPHLGRSRLVAWLLADADEPALLLPRPDWPTIGGLHGRLLEPGGALTVLRSDGPVPVRDVLAEAARTIGPAVASGGGPIVATTNQDPRQAPPADAGLTVAATPAAAAPAEGRWPPDVVLTDVPPTEPLPLHPVTGRAPAVVSDPDLLDGPVDEGLINPSGFVRHPTRGQATLTDGARPRLAGPGIDRALERGVTPAVVAALRPYAAVRVAWPASPTPELVRAVATLATAGVPLLGGPPPTTDSPAALGAELCARLATEPDLATPLAREEHSIELRRAALRRHSTLGWRGRLARAADLDWHRFPTCSLLLPLPAGTDLDRALERIAPQREVDAEIVVATTGPTPASDELAHLSAHRITVVAPTGPDDDDRLLAAAAAAASGDVLVTLTAGDWYGPDAVTDLLWARHYSGAQLVVLPAELSYDPIADRTARREVATERFAVPPASSTVLVGRSDLRALGGFLPGPAAATTLARNACTQGGAAYATHGLNHLARQERYGPDQASPEEEWDGFRPSRLLDARPPGRDPKEPTA